MSRVVVVGAGAMGLAAAYRAARNGHDVDVVEAANDPGGMAGHFDFDGLSLERFYHFICKTDEPTFALMRELGIADMLRWRTTTMGFYNEGSLHEWGNPIALLKLPTLGLIDKIRYGIFALVCVRRDSWDAIENESADSWIKRWCGETVYRKMWQPLFHLKFYEYADNISASWIWTRIRRIGRSRKSMFQEELGYMEGGTITLVNALIEAIKAHGGRVHLGAAAKEIKSEAGHVTGVSTAIGDFPADAVICTAPTPYVASLVPALPDDWKAKYNDIHNIGVICVIFKLKKSVTPHFWVNISEPSIPIPGVIEFSNLREMGGDSVVYVPYYMPTSNEKFTWPDERLLDEAFLCLKTINPAITESDILATKVARLRYGQPICEPGFGKKLLPIQTPIEGLQIADTCYYYPEDRGISESVRVGSEMAIKLGVQV